jgi:hypothetical protein
MRILSDTWPQGWSPDSLLEAAQLGRRLTLNPVDALAELEKADRNARTVTEDILKLEVGCEPRLRALAHLGVKAACEPQVKDASGVASLPAPR